MEKTIDLTDTKLDVSKELHKEKSTMLHSETNTETSEERDKSQSGEEEEGESPIIKKFDEMLMKCTRSIQDYLAYLCEIKVDDLFPSNIIYPNTETKFKCTETNNYYKLKLDIVEKNYIFDLSKFNKKVVVDAMNDIVKHLITIYYPTIVNSILNLPIHMKNLHNSCLICDPSNTTFIAFNKDDIVWSKSIRDDYPKRIGFTWVS